MKWMYNDSRIHFGRANDCLTGLRGRLFCPWSFLVCARRSRRLPRWRLTLKPKEIRQSGRDVVSFSVGEPDFVTPQYIRTAAHEALDMGLTKYTPAAGTLGLRRAICEKLRWDNGLEYSPSQVIVSNGAKFSIYASLAAIVNPGDEVLIPTPCWVSYPEIVRIVGGVPVLAQGPCQKGLRHRGGGSRAICHRAHKSVDSQFAE